MQKTQQKTPSDTTGTIPQDSESFINFKYIKNKLVT
jgi:hypothetical protein